MNTQTSSSPRNVSVSVPLKVNQKRTSLVKPKLWLLTPFCSRLATGTEGSCQPSPSSGKKLALSNTYWPVPPVSHTRMVLSTVLPRGLSWYQSLKLAAPCVQLLVWPSSAYTRERATLAGGLASATPSLLASTPSVSRTMPSSAAFRSLKSGWRPGVPLLNDLKSRSTSGRSTHSGGSLLTSVQAKPASVPEQLARQPSPSLLFPSSQNSLGALMPSPQVATQLPLVHEGSRLHVGVQPSPSAL